MLASTCAGAAEPDSIPASPPAETVPPPSESSPASSPSADTPGAAATCRGDVERVDTFEYRTIDEVDPNLLSLDVYSPATTVDCPALIWVHGGSWQLGDKATAATRVKAEHFVERGYVFVSMNYRLAAEDNDVQWPAFGNDVAAGAAWLIENASDIGIDAGRIGLMGHSAGAHLVSSVGTNPSLLAEYGLDRDAFPCVASLDTDLFDLDTPVQRNRDLVQAAFDDDTALLIDGSPSDQATEHTDDGPIAEFLIVVRGTAARIQRATDFAAILTTVGATASLVDVSPYTHRDVNVELGEPGEETVTPVVTDFFNACL